MFQRGIRKVLTNLKNYVMTRLDNAKGRRGASESLTPPTAGPPGSTITFQELSDVYLEWARGHKRPATVKSDTCRLRQLTGFFGAFHLPSIRVFTVEQYKSRRLSQVKPSTIDRELAVLQHMMNQAVEWDLLQSHPITNRLLYNQDRIKERTLSYDEEKSLLSSCESPLRELILVALHTGMRQGQLLKLQWSMVDLTSGQVHLPMEINKDKRNHTLFLNAVARNALVDVRDNGSRFVFPWRSSSKLYHLFKRTLRAAGLPRDIRFHDLRHTFATRLAEQGCDMGTLRLLVQHGSLHTTQRYIHPSAQAMRQAVATLAGEPYAANLSQDCTSRTTHIPATAYPAFRCITMAANTIRAAIPDAKRRAQTNLIYAGA